MVVNAALLEGLVAEVTLVCWNDEADHGFGLSLSLTVPPSAGFLGRQLGVEDTVLPQ